MQEVKNYTAKDIERYHNGQMSAAEKHALEKAALDDPFLADAIEGYTYATTIDEDLQKISERLNEKTNKRRVIPFFQRYQWVKYAALFLIVAGSGWIIYQTSIKKNDSLATNNINKSVPQNAPLNQTIDSSSKTLEITPTTPTVAESTTEEKRNKNRSVAVKKEAEEKKKFESVTVNLTSSAPVATRNVEAFKKADTYKSPSGYNTSTIGDSIKDKTSVALDDKKRNNEVKQNNDTVQLGNIVLQPTNNATLQEVIVSKGIQRKQAFAKPQVIIDSLEPSEGWSYFDDYIANNIKRPDELKQKPTSQEVELSFDVNENGEPVNIKVVRSLCSRCDEEAIRLLKEGPKWTKKKNKKGKVVIRF